MCKKMLVSFFYVPALFLLLSLPTSRAAVPVVTPRNGSQQVAVVPNQFTLTFSVDPSVPPENITWFFRTNQQTNELDAADDPFLSFSADRLSLSLLVPTREGTYILNATNADGTGTGFISLDIRSQPAFQQLPESQVKHELENVTFNCFATGDPTPVIDWIFNHTLVINSTDSKYKLGQFGQPDVGSLTVYDLEFPDTGIYICRATNDFGSLNATAVELSVQVLPRVTVQPSDITPTAGGVAYLRCNVRGFPPVSVFWQKNGTNVTDVNSIVTYSQSTVYDHARLETTGTLTLTGSVLSTDGNYTCTASNSLKTYEVTTSLEAQVFVQYPPSTAVSDDIVRVNQTFPTSFFCRSFGIPSPTLRWYFEGSRVTTGDSVVVTMSSSVNETGLVIQETTLSISSSMRATHEGNYTCVAVNGIENLISTPENVTTELFVQVPPRLVSPGGVSVLGVVGRAVTLRFVVEDASPDVRPSNVDWYFGGSPVNGNGTKYQFSTDRRSITVTGLEHTDEGNYTILVSNEAGSDNVTIRLEIEAGPEFVLPPLMDINVLQNSQAVLTCRVMAEPQPIVEWHRSLSGLINMSLPEISVNYSNGSSLREYVSTLTLSDVMMADTDDYTCIIYNDHGRINATAHLEVQVPPQITLNPVSTVSVRNASVSLNCQTFGSPVPNITWIKGGVAFDPASFPVAIAINTSVTGFTRSSTLVFSSLTFSEAGEYICQATNDLVTPTSSNSTAANLTVNQSPLLVADNVLPVVNQTQTVNMTCVFLGLPPPIITWSRFDSIDISNNPSKFQVFASQTRPPEGGVLSSSTLQVSAVDETDTGNYTCTATNAVYEGAPVNITVHSFFVLVQTSPIVQRLSGADVQIGVLTQSIILDFRVIRDVPAVDPRAGDIKWFINDTEIVPDERHLFSESRQSLNILNLTLPSDEGRYTLVASNVIGNGNNSLFLDVEIAPVITNNSGVVLAVQEQNASFNCIAVSEPVHFTRWTFNGTNITNSFKYLIKGNNTVNSTLTVFNVSLEDRGSYGCHADNVHGTDSAVSELQVQVPPTITDNPDSSTVLVNNNAQFRCCANGVPLPSITWLKNTMKFDVGTNNRSVTVERILDSNCSTLTISASVFSDQGNYSCVATNVLADTIEAVSQSSSLTVQYPPQVFQLSQVNYVRNESDPFVLQCRAFGIPPPVIYWLPGPFNVTADIGDMDRFLSSSELSSLQSRLTESRDSRLLTLSDQCPISSGLPVCSMDQNITNDCSVPGSLCSVPCAVAITNSTGIDDLNRTVSVSTLTLCSVLKADELSYTCLAVNNISNAIGTPEAVSTNLIVQVVPDVSSAQTGTQIAFRGHNTTLLFNITSASPDVVPENITWSFTHRFTDGERIIGSSSHYLFSSDRRSLTIVNLTTNDTGTYRLTATNAAGVDQATAELSVQALPEIILFTSGPVISTTGRELSLDCFADGSPLQNVSWLFTNTSNADLFELRYVIDNETARTGYMEYIPLVDGLDSVSITERYSISDNTVPSEQEYGRLTIRNVTAYDAGSYRCTLVNIYNIDEPYTQSVDVRIQLNPSIIQNPQSINCTAGGSCTLSCTVSGVPAPNVTWYQDSSIAVPLSQSSYTYSQTVSHLVIDRTSLSDAGSYQCNGSNELYSSESTISDIATLTVLYPPEVISPPIKTTVNETFAITLQCTVTGYPRPTVIWERGVDNERLTNSSKFSISDTEESSSQLYNVTSTLMIRDVSESDELTYRCSGSNGVQNLISVASSATAQLIVQVPPTIISPSDIDVVKGSNLLLTFNITRASPLVDIEDIEWSFVSINNTKLTLNISCTEIGAGCSDTRYRRYNFSVSPYETTLTIRNAQVEDFGMFSITAVNPAGVRPGSVYLTVNVSAQLNVIDGYLINITKEVDEVRNVTMSCSADGIPIPSILWFLNNSIIRPNLRPRVDITVVNATGLRSDVALHPGNNSITSTITITNVNVEDDQGFYVCQASNGIGQPSVLNPPGFRLVIEVELPDFCASEPCENNGICYNQPDRFICECVRTETATFSGTTCSERVPVEIPPRLIESPVGDRFVRLFDMVTLNCVAEGQPDPTIRWFKDGNEIGSIGSNSLSYVIQELTLDQRGRYRCTATNVAGTVQSNEVLVNIIDVVEYTANLTIPKSQLASGANISVAADGIVNGINNDVAGGEVGGSSSFFFFIERSGTPINRTVNITVPIKVTIRLQQDTPDANLTRTVEAAVKMFGYQLEINEEGGVIPFNYCPITNTTIRSPDGNRALEITITWPETLLGREQQVNCPCDFNLTSTTLVARRNCSGNFRTRAEWERPNTDACNFSPTTRRLCQLATLSSSLAILQGLDDITRETQNIDSDGATVTSFALESVESDVIENMTLVSTSAEVYNNILGVNRTELGMAQQSSGSSSRMQRSILNITRNLQPDTMIMLDRLMIVTGNMTPSVLTSNISTSNMSQGNRNGSAVSLELPTELSTGSYSFSVFANDGLFIPRTFRPGSSVITQVVDFTANSSEESVSLNQPLRLSFGSANLTVTPGRVIICVFWDVEAEDWSSEGCRLINESCFCDHLTSFAILLDVEAGEMRDAPEDEAFEYITYIGLTISTISLVITLITYLGTPKLRNSEANQLLINLCFALLGLYITFLLALQGSVLSDPVCGIIGALVHYFFLAVFFIMAAESVDLFIKLVIVLGPKIHRFILKTVIIAWIAPIFFVLFSFAPNYDHYINQHYCGPTGVPLYVGLMVPFFVVYIFNWTIFFIIMVNLLKKSAANKFNEAKKRNRKAEVKQQCRVAFTVSVLFGLGWGFGLLSSQAIGVTAVRIIFNSIFTVLTVFQGFFIFILYVVLSPNARKVWKKWILRKEDKRTFGESTSSSGPTTTRSTKNTSVPNKSAAYYGNNPQRKGTLYRNVYTAARREKMENFTSISREFGSSDADSSQPGVMEELKERLQFRSMDEEEDRVFMNPLEDLGDVTSLVSDSHSIHETMFSFPQPLHSSGEREESDEEIEDEVGDDVEALEEGKCSTFKNPLRQTVRNTNRSSNKASDATELLSQPQDEDETDVAVSTTIALDLSIMNGGFSDNSQSAGLSDSSQPAIFSQGLSSGDGTLLIKTEDELSSL